MKPETQTPHTLPEQDLSKVVFFMGAVRSGTTVFRKMMSSHPKIRDRGEIFNSNNPRGFFKFFREQVVAEPDLAFPEHHGEVFLSYVASVVPREGTVLLDVKYEHLTLINEAWQLPFANPPMLRLIKRSKIKVVHLRRRHFYSVLSNLVAVNTGRYHMPVGDDAEALPEKRQVAVERQPLINAMKRRKRITDLVDQTFDESQLLALDYEHVFDDQGDFKPEVVAQLAAFLGVENEFDRVPSLKKVIDEPLSAVISNYAEIADLEHMEL